MAAALCDQLQQSVRSCDRHCADIANAIGEYMQYTSPPPQCFPTACFFACTTHLRITVWAMFYFSFSATL